MKIRKNPSEYFLNLCESRKNECLFNKPRLEFLIQFTQLRQQDHFRNDVEFLRKYIIDNDFNLVFCYQNCSDLL